ncbi:MAG: GNAT family N-acetyltransferase [Chloroflexota bacterium]
MIKEISPNKIKDCIPYSSDPQMAMVLASIIEGNTRAQFWQATQSANSSVCLLWDKGNNVVYLLGDTLSPEATQELAHLISTQIKEQAVQEELVRFDVRALSPALEEAIPRIFQGVEFHQTSKLFYVLRQDRILTQAVPTKAAVQYALIDQAFLEQDHLQHLQYLKAEIVAMWPSQTTFCERGFGYAALVADTIVCWCTAEYVSAKTCGIGIETIQEYQGKGIATATATHFVAHCLEHNITPYWECNSHNSASIRVAEKVGFERIQKSAFWKGMFQC